MGGNVTPFRPHALICTGGRIDALLDRLQKVRRAGKGFTACCPAHDDKSASLSLSESDEGKILLHCFAGCSTASVLAAIGLSLADLFPERLSPTTPVERKAMQLAAQESRWKAALGVATFETCIALAAASKMRKGEALTAEDHDRLQLACDRLDGAKAVFIAHR
jgi:DNA primase